MPDPHAKPFRIVAVSLCETEVVLADRLTDILQEAGWPKATRSLIVREALERLRDDILDKTPEQIFRYFVDRQALRLGPRAKPESSPSAPASPIGRDSEK